MGDIISHHVFGQLLPSSINDASGDMTSDGWHYIEIDGDGEGSLFTDGYDAERRRG